MFLTFALFTLLGALALFRSRNLVVAGLCMVLTFFGVAGLFVLLGNPVAAALQIIVYSGAIVVLLLFVIMLLSSHEEEAETKSRPIQRWLGAVLVAGLGAGAVALVAASRTITTAALPLQGPMTLHKLGHSLFYQHLVGFEAAGLLLLAAMVGAILLVRKEI